MVVTGFRVSCPRQALFDVPRIVFGYSERKALIPLVLTIVRLDHGFGLTFVAVPCKDNVVLFESRGLTVVGMSASASQFFNVRCLLAWGLLLLP